MVPLFVACLFAAGSALAEPCTTVGDCLEDGYVCTASQCEAGQCVAVVTQGCLIQDGSQWPCKYDGDTEAGNSCHYCSSSLNPTGWSTRVDGTSCASDGNECSVDVCQAGACVHLPAAAGIACGPGLGDEDGDSYATCDQAQYCDGTTIQCVDAVKSSTTVCRDTGLCGIDDMCDGVTKECIAHGQIKAEGEPCGEASGPCDAVDYCDGNNSACPTGNTVPDGSPCDLDGNAATLDECQAGACTPPGRFNTLVVRVKFSGVAAEPFADTASVIARMNDVVTKASYGAADVTVRSAGSIVQLEHPKDWYESDGRFMEIAITTEVLNFLLEQDQEILGDVTVSAYDDIRHVVIMVNQNIEDRATTGLFPFHLTPSNGPAKDINLSASINTLSTNSLRQGHAIGHQMGMVDLYQHDGTSVPDDARPPTGWDMMADTTASGTGAIPLMWSKMTAGWVDGSRVEWVPRSEWSQNGFARQFSIPFQHSLAPGMVGAVVLGRATDAEFDAATEFFFIEARCRDGQDCEAGVPSNGVLVYSASSSLPQGYVPVRVVDRTEGTDTVADAALVEPGQSVILPGTGLLVTLSGSMTQDAGYVITLSRTDQEPVAQPYDVGFGTADPAWMSQDLWIENENSVAGGLECGEDVNPDFSVQPIGGQENRIWARVHNYSNAVAQNVLVHFQLSEPYSATEGFEDYADVIIDEIPAGSHCFASIAWEPEPVNDPHNCVYVQLFEIPEDLNGANNWAQRNFSVIPAATGGAGYPSSVLPFAAHNPGKDPLALLFAVENIPAGWQWTLEPAGVVLKPGERVEGKLIVQPPDGARVCTTHKFRVVSYKRGGDTLVKAGGTDIEVRLGDQTALEIGAKWLRCSDGEGLKKQQGPFMNRAVEEYDRFIAQSGRREAECGVMFLEGCTSPARTGERLGLRFSDQDGNPIFHEVMTDSKGCFRDAAYAVQGGKWTATATFKGDACVAPARASADLEIDLPRTGDTDGDGLADGDEPHGDLDGDGLPCFMDRDCDGDGVEDGREGKGDADGDGFLNVNDRDSDNDGFIDGRDNFPTNVCRAGGKCCEHWSPMLWVLMVLALVLIIVASMVRRLHWLAFVALALLIAAHAFAWHCCLDGWVIPSMVGLIICVLAVAGVYVRNRFVK